MSEQTTGKQKLSFFYGAARIIATILFKTVMPVRYFGAEKLAGDAPFIVIANHQHWMDPIILALPIKRYQVTFLAKKELVKHPIANYVLRDMHVIPVDRHNTDMAAMRACVKAVRDGQILGIFPEGTRHHKGVMEEIEGGVAMIALRSGVPLIPVYVTKKLKFFRRSDVYVGDPIPLEDLKAQGVNKDTCQALLERITATYADMQEQAERHS